MFEEGGMKKMGVVGAGKALRTNKCL